VGERGLARWTDRELDHDETWNIQQHHQHWTRHIHDPSLSDEHRDQITNCLG
jgi:hypothetical protein